MHDIECRFIIMQRLYKKKFAFDIKCYNNQTEDKVVVDDSSKSFTFHKKCNFYETFMHSLFGVIL